MLSFLADGVLHTSPLESCGRQGDAVSQTDAWCIDRETCHASTALHACRAITCPGSARIASRDHAGGQTLVEFALIIPVFLLLMLGVVQMIVVGGAALAVNQAAISCARYASLNPSLGQISVGTYLTANASPLINDSGLQPLVLSPVTVPRATGSEIG